MEAKAARRSASSMCARVCPLTCSSWSERRSPDYAEPVPRAVVLAGIRTPIGRYGGALAHVRPDDLAGLVIREVVARSGVPAEQIEDVWFGCANQAGEDNRNVARMGALLAGLPESVAGVTVNRLCASGLTAVA